MEYGLFVEYGLFLDDLMCIYEIQAYFMYISTMH